MCSTLSWVGSLVDTEWPNWGWGEGGGGGIWLSNLLNYFSVSGDSKQKKDDSHKKVVLWPLFLTPPLTQKNAQKPFSQLSSLIPFLSYSLTSSHLSSVVCHICSILPQFQGFRYFSVFQSKGRQLRRSNTRVPTLRLANGRVGHRTVSHDYGQGNRTVIQSGHVKNKDIGNRTVNPQLLPSW